jgi:predicted PurR-regulated permease PerM
MSTDRRDVAHVFFAIVVLALLAGSSAWILRPFVAAGVWATTIVISTWPILLRLQKRLGGRRGLAVAVLCGFLLAVVVLPLVAAVASIASNVDAIVAFTRGLPERQLPPAPAWVEGLPVVGPRAAAAWTQASQAGTQALLVKASPYLADVARWFVSRVGSIGGLLAEFLLTVVLAGVLYSTGETAAKGVVAFARRLAGDEGEGAVRLAAGAVRGVALGVIVTAVGQSVLGGIGLAVAGVPFAGLLTAGMLLLCVMQVGPTLVLFGGIAYLYSTGSSGWGTALLVWSVLVGTMDNFVRPILIRKGADLPLLLIFAGVIGGLMGFGLIGIFIGPVLLAVSYTLLESWVTKGNDEATG